jgi:hypothetical protein
MKIASSLSVALLAGLSVACGHRTPRRSDPQGGPRPLQSVELRCGLNTRPPENPRV